MIMILRLKLMNLGRRAEAIEAIEAINLQSSAVDFCWPIAMKTFLCNRSDTILDGNASGDHRPA